MKDAITNIPYHAYNLHDKCGSWCKANENKENYVGLQLKSQVLFDELVILFDKLAANATKFLMAASSQANESLNNSMASSAPKRICYSTSEASDYRFACTVLHKNYGEAYISSIFHALGMESTERLANRIQRTNQCASKRKLREKEVSFKRRRIELAQARSQLKYRKEKSKGLAYSSHMSLFDNDDYSITQTSVAEDTSNPEAKDVNSSAIFHSNDTAIVFFDLETGGFDMFKDEVLQISLKCDDKSYVCYLTPTRAINPRASEVHNLTRINKNLYKNGEQVVTRAKAVVVSEVLQFLKAIGKKCILVAHNCEFDSKRFILLIKSCDFLCDFKKVVVGFTDTLPLFRKTIVDVENYKLTTLAACKLNISCSEAHDAQFDVEVLEKLAKAFLQLNDLLATNATFDDICAAIDKKQRSKINIHTFLPLDGTISKTMMQRLSEQNFTYYDLIDAFINGEDQAKQLLQGNVNGSPTVIKTTKNLNAIIEHLKFVTKE
ncbi:uncharacterized protein LOC131663015 [Phymastichus coffea]|uniref:uncharacterized protein LOC131663015 n=1 Tax=Phymastichus coffea TaxID=108790 RepID=UPI00273AC5C3|nr:uncharacterized protein LOC131663015 [Phymastichus coffea]